MSYIPVNKLTEIGLKYGTDKASHHVFTEFYDDVFKTYTNPRILEIGVANTASIHMYLNYWENPYVVGMDIDDKSTLVNGKWKFVQGDQANIDDLRKCVDGEDKFDIILDDGGHTMKQQQVSFGFLIDHIKSGGYYIIEDLHTSSDGHYREADCEFTSFDMLKKIKSGETYFSNYIDKDHQVDMVNKIESIVIWSKFQDYYLDSVTSLIKIK